MSIELVPLCNLTAHLRSPIALANTPAGTRLIFEVETGTVSGERLRGTVKGSANADWLLATPDGTGILDVRVLVETHDGALVFISYGGRTDLSAGGTAPIYAAPMFETGDERYAWLNKVQAIAKATFDGTTIAYELYEVR